MKKKFKLSIFKGNELKQTKVVWVNSSGDLNFQKNVFWNESPYRKPLCWMGIKRIR